MTTPASLLMLSTAILTADGTYSMRSILLSEARSVATAASSIESYIGHQSTAELMSRLLGIQVEANRGSAAQQPNQTALIWRLETRLAEGQLLSDAELRSLPGSWKLLTRVA
jgi:Domain of unknown function (DUF1874)